MATVSSETLDGDPDNNTSPPVVTAIGLAAGELTLVKSITDGVLPKPGETITYTITFTNNTITPLSGIVITDTTPPNTTFSAADATAPLPDLLTGVTVTTPAVGSAGEVKWEFDGELGAGNSGSVTLTVTVE